MQFLNHKQIANAVARIGVKRSVLVLGETGIGKTAIHHELCRRPEFADHIKMDPIEATQLSDGSVWMPDIDREMGISRELPNERFGVSKTNRRGVNGSKPSMIFIDEGLKCAQFIKNMLAPVYNDRRVGDYHLVEGSLVWMASNLTVEGLGDSLQPHLRSRLIVLYLRKPTATEWVEEFAIPNELSAEVIAFVHMFPNVLDSFVDYLPGGKFAGKPQEKENPFIFNPKLMQDGFISPRTLNIASDILMEQQHLDAESLTATLTGAIGEPGAKEMAAFVRFGQEICAYEEVIKNPAKAPLSKNATAQIVQTYQFLTRCQGRDEAGAITEYVMRMKNEMQSLFCHSVANSSKISDFVTVKQFGTLMRDNKVFFATK